MKKLALIFAGLLFALPAHGQTSGINIPGLPGATSVSPQDLIPIDQAVTPSVAHPNGRATRSAALSTLVGAGVISVVCPTDGVTDCNPAIVSAISQASASPGTAVLIPATGTLRSSLAISFGAVPVKGVTPITPSNPPTGPHIQCDIAVTTACVTFGVSGATSAGGNAENLIVSFAPGTPAANSQAIVFQGHNSRCNGLMAYNAYDAFVFQNGISAHCNNIFTWNVTDQHVVDNGFPELYINQARFGLNGPGDQANSVSFIGLTGNDPNTIFCTNCQFNLGSQSPSHLVNYFSLTSEVNGILHIENSTIDMTIGNCTSLIKTDSTAFVFRLQIANSAINATACTLIDQSTQAAAPKGLQIVNNPLLALSSLSIDTGTLTGEMVFDISHNAEIVGNVTLNGGAGNGTNSGKGVFSFNRLDGNLTLTSTKPWGDLTLLGNKLSGSYTDTAQGIIHADGPVITFTPVLQLGATAASSSNQSGLAKRMPDGSVQSEFGIIVSNLNAGSGTLSITGFPFTCATNDGLNAGFNNPGMVPITLISAQSLTGAPVVTLNQNSAAMNLLQSAAAGYSSLTNSNVQVGTIMSGKMACTPK